ncbi:MAG: Cys-tRNA(Pro) deacylase [Actinomycetaceae bacterium]|nr:Cys-tRNA(Pro) deacylase [Arcanobacterium sp.]MDD7504568.1 Cys-tRNA(Pro) deacylase [Actinomycetaceae bacterium]MDY6143211.1 Cys-tRNA(Pro) deacylase [Arcanobacterium sp.]
MPKKQGASRSAATPALRVLESSGTPYELIEYEHSDVMEHGFALDTVAVLGLNPDEVFKTLLAEADGDPVVGVVPASHHMNLKQLAKAVKAKHAAMMDPSKAERLTGYIKGGISPLGQRKLYPTVIDSSAENLPSMIVSGGKRSLSVKLSPHDLAHLTHGQFAPVATSSHTGGR